MICGRAVKILRRSRIVRTGVPARAEITPANLIRVMPAKGEF